MVERFWKGVGAARRLDVNYGRTLWEGVWATSAPAAENIARLLKWFLCIAFHSHVEIIYFLLFQFEKSFTENVTSIQENCTSLETRINALMKKVGT